MSTHLKHRINAGRVAIKNQIGFFRDQLGRVPSEWKEDNTRVTFADFAISEKIFRELREHFPEDDYCSEEGNPQDEVAGLTARNAWVLDPVDGTNNYAAGLPLCSISLALLKDGVPVYGFIYDALRDTLIQGGPGEGVYDGCRKVVRQEPPFTEHSMVGLHFPMDEKLLSAVRPVTEFCRVRSLGSSALHLAYVAVGLLDGTAGFKGRVWDVAAAHALLAGVGSGLHYLNGNPFPLRTFHPRLGPCPYMAGTSAFLETLAPGLRGAYAS